MIQINLDEIIKKCEQGEYTDIAQAGSANCFAISDDYVLVKHRNPVFAEKFRDLTRKLDDDMKCICTVVDYRVVGDDVVYELQRRARGKHFKTTSITKQYILDKIASIKKLIELQSKNAEEGKTSMSKETIESIYKDEIDKLEAYTKTAEYALLSDKPTDDLLRRYGLLMEMPNKHITDFFESVLTLHDHKVEYDNSGNNVLYDNENGFSIIDLDDCSHRPNFRGDINHMLDANNYQTMDILLGINELLIEVHLEDKPAIIEKMRQVLKRICIATFDFEHNGERMTREIMEQSLSTYRQYGIELTYDEIVQDMKNKKDVQELGKESLQEQNETKYIDDTHNGIQQQEKIEKGKKGNIQNL